jgi:hypothetical protein
MTIYQDRLTFLNGRQEHDGSQDWVTNEQDSSPHGLEPGSQWRTET